MSSISITREHTFEMAHRLMDHPEGCRRIHGHSYRIEITIARSGLSRNGMVIDFSEVRKVLCAWLDRELDHQLVLWEGDPLVQILNSARHDVVDVPFHPTAENIVSWLGCDIFPQLLLQEIPEDRFLQVTRIRLWETEKCSAEWRA